MQCTAHKLAVLSPSSGTMYFLQRELHIQRHAVNAWRYVAKQEVSKNSETA